MEALRNHGEDAKRGYMTAAHVDSPGYFDDTQGNNKGRKIRHHKAKERKDVNMMGLLQHRYMLNCIDVKLKLIPTKDVFSLIAPVATIAYKSVITDVALIVRKMKVNPSMKELYCKQMPGNL